jgi:hypothetical protein
MRASLDANSAKLLLIEFYAVPRREDEVLTADLDENTASTVVIKIFREEPLAVSPFLEKH